MPLYMVFNDTALLNWQPQPFECRLAVARTAAAVKGVVAQRRDSVLLTARGWDAISLRDGRPLKALLGADADRDDVRALLGAQNRSAIDGKEILESELLRLECSIQGESSEAAAIQAVLGGALLSIPTDHIWENDWIGNSVMELSEDEEIQRRDLQVRNFYHGESPQVHLDFLRTDSLSLQGSEDLWARRATFFPRIKFLARVENQLKCLGDVEFSSVVDRLVELQATLDEWDASGVPEPQWRSHVTDEYESRRRKCHFVDDAGVSHCYETHARFTPGAGRVHFRLLGQIKAMEIAHIGSKIE